MTVATPLTDHQREILAMHTAPRHGSPYWIEQAKSKGVNVDSLETLEDLAAAFGEMDEEALRNRPLADFIPRQVASDMSRMMIGETGGATGAPKRTVYDRDEFHTAFVEPFAHAARLAGFPERAPWLWVGPSGPHIIGKVAPRLANSLGAQDPFSVDFDPRWARTLAAGSLARERYLEHVVRQALAVINAEAPPIIFTTPAVLAKLAENMTDAQCESVAGVHYGGQRVEAEELRRFQEEVFPNAVHLSGYGNTLFGCCLELDVTAGRTPEYFPFQDRLALQLHTQEAHGVTERRIHFSRFDRSFLIVNMRERDVADEATRPASVPAGFGACGVRDPRPPTVAAKAVDASLY